MASVLSEAQVVQQAFHVINLIQTKQSLRRVLKHIHKQLKIHSPLDYGFQKLSDHVELSDSGRGLNASTALFRGDRVPDNSEIYLSVNKIGLKRNETILDHYPIISCEQDLNQSDLITQRVSDKTKHFLVGASIGAVNPRGEVILYGQ